MALAALLASGCGGGEEPAESSTPPAGGVFQDSLALLPAEDALRRQILFADLVRLREAYPGPKAYGRALQGVWLPDALVGANGPLWRKAYGFGLGGVDSFVAGGFHPEELAVAVGRFNPARVEARLAANGWEEVDGLYARGEDGSVNTETPVGQLALSALDRVAVGADRLVAASTTALARAALDPDSTLSDDPDLSLAAGALGSVTSAILLPAELVRPPAGTPIELIAGEPAVVVGVGTDDRAPDDRVLEIVLVYAKPEQAEADAARFRSKLAALKLTGEGPQTFGDLVERVSVDVVGGRAVLISGRLVPKQGPGSWRGLLERGDLSPLARPQQ